MSKKIFLFVFSLLVALDKTYALGYILRFKQSNLNKGKHDFKRLIIILEFFDYFYIYGVKNDYI